MIYLHTNFQMHSSNCSLVITIKLKAKYRFHTATKIFDKKLCQHKLHILYGSVTTQISGYYIKHH